MPCPDDESLAAFVARSLDEPRRAAIERHVANCEPCAAALSTFAELFVSGSSVDTLPRSAEPPMVGSTLGRFRILHEVGRGAMGIVYAAHDPELDRTVAVKLLAPSTLVVPDVEQRLRREARAMARLTHPNVVTVLDVGTDHSQVFVVMELVAGTTLRSWLDAMQRNADEIVEAFVAAGRGLAAAHAAGVVHRDFKPDNVLIDTDGHVRVTDFGLARLGTRERASPTEIGGTPVDHVTRGRIFAGTPAYMAPEQIRGDDVDPAADQFAWCVALYEALQGANPFARDDLGDRLAAIEAGHIDLSGLPSRLRPILRQGLDADPHRRYADMPALLRAVQAGSRPRRRALAAVGLCGVAAAVALAVADRDPPCPDLQAELAGAWDASMSDRLRVHVADTVDRDLAERVVAAVDGRVQIWRAAAGQQCALQADAALDPTRLAVRADCLRRRAVELATMVDSLQSADERTLRLSLAAIEELPDPSRCDNPAHWLTEEHALLDPAVRTEVAAVRRDLARADAMRRAGQPEPARALAVAAVERARGLEHAPVLVEALVLRGRIDDDLGDHEPAVEAMREAARASVAASLHELAIQALLAHVDVLDDDTHCDEIRGLVDLALGHAEALADDALRREVLLRKAYNERNAGNFDEARALWDDAAALATTDGDKMVDGLNHAMLAVDLGFADVGARVFGRWADAVVTVYGPTHPGNGMAAHNHAVALCELGRIDDALAEHDRSRAVETAIYGEEHASVARSHLSAASCLLGVGAASDADPHLDAARRILAALGDTGPLTIFADVLHAASLVDRGHVAEAENAFADASRRADVLFGADHPNTARYALLFGTVLERHDEAEAALPHVRGALSVFERTMGPAQPLTSAAKARLGVALTRLDRRQEARAQLDAALSRLDPAHGSVAVIIDALQARATLQESDDAATTDRDRAAQLLADHPQLASRRVPVEPERASARPTRVRKTDVRSRSEL